MNKYIHTIILFFLAGTFSLQAQNCLHFEDIFMLGSSGCKGPLNIVYDTDPGDLATFTTQYTNNNGNTSPCTSQLINTDKTIYYDFYKSNGGISYTLEATVEKYMNGINSNQSIAISEIPSTLTSGEYRLDVRVKYHSPYTSAWQHATVKRQYGSGSVTTVCNQMPYNTQPGTHWRVTDECNIGTILCFEYVACPSIGIYTIFGKNRAYASINYGAASTSPINYSWEFTNVATGTTFGPYSGSSLSAVNFPGCGEYEIELTIAFSNGCVLTVSRTVNQICPDIPFDPRVRRVANPNDLAQHIKLFPNPATNYLMIQYDLLGTQEASLELMSLTGQVVKRMKLDSEQQDARLEVADLAKGAYFARIKADGQTIKNQKIMVIQ